ncbi:MAG: YciI family protein [Nocardioidaceae bacterium]
MFEHVLLRRPATTPELPETELERLQEAHLGHPLRMRREGYMRTAGPVGDQPDDSLPGLCLHQVGDLERVRALAESDPSVRAGRLAVKVMAFYFPRGDIPLGNTDSQ